MRKLHAVRVRTDKAYFGQSQIALIFAVEDNYPIYPMMKYLIYLDQLNFLSILQEDFLGHLKL